MKDSQRRLQEFGKFLENQGGSELYLGSEVRNADRAIEIGTDGALVEQWKALNSSVKAEYKKAFVEFEGKRQGQNEAFQGILQQLAEDGGATRDAILPIMKGHHINKVGFYSELIGVMKDSQRRLQEFGESLENQGGSELQTSPENT